MMVRKREGGAPRGGEDKRKIAPELCSSGRLLDLSDIKNHTFTALRSIDVERRSS